MTSLPVHDKDSQRWLEEHAHLWAELGVVSEEQAASIVRLETSGVKAPAAEVAGGPELPLYAELCAYLGSILALVGGTVMVTRTWDSWPSAARIAIGLVVAATGLLGGRAVLQIEGSSARRLAGFLWLIGTGGAALATVVTAIQLGSEDPGVNALAAGCVVIAIGLGLWRNLDRPLQLLTVVGGVIAATAGFADLVSLAVWPIGIALFLASLGVGWLAVRGRLHPELWVLLVAGAGMMIGAGMVTDLVENVGMIFGLLTAVGVVGVGLALHRVPLTVIGVIGFLQYLIGVLQTYLTGAIGAIVVLVLGLAMVVAVVLTLVRHRGRPA